jgi:hypothetical protein
MDCRARLELTEEGKSQASLRPADREKSNHELNCWIKNIGMWRGKAFEKGNSMASV